MGDEALRVGLRGVPTLVEVLAELFVVDAVGEQVPSDDEDGMRDGDRGLLRSPAALIRFCRRR